jgi:hypothetical protein
VRAAAVEGWLARAAYAERLVATMVATRRRPLLFVALRWRPHYAADLHKRMCANTGGWLLSDASADDEGVVVGGEVLRADTSPADR